MLFSSHHINSIYHQRDLTTVGVDLNHLSKVVFTRFLHCKADVFPPFHTVLFGNKSLSVAQEFVF